MTNWYAKLMRANPVLLLDLAAQRVSRPLSVTDGEQQEDFLLAYDCSTKANQLEAMALAATPMKAEFNPEAEVCRLLANELRAYAQVLSARLLRTFIPAEVVREVSIDRVGAYARLRRLGKESQEADSRRAEAFNDIFPKARHLAQLLTMRPLH